MQPVSVGAEAQIFRSSWNGREAIVKYRGPKTYRHPALDFEIRRRRTVHEAQVMSNAKLARVRTPLIYFVDPAKCEIVMEVVNGSTAKQVLTTELCVELGRFAGRLHANGIIHGDLTTSNFIVDTDTSEPVIIDFGLAHHSERVEDMATDIRLIKEVFSSAHAGLRGAFESFMAGYAGAHKKSPKVMETVLDIERRGRYARVE
ncbi:MAG: KEOPS complex kinase/ATPase Bud32 [Nitrososphaera sp.]